MSEEPLLRTREAAGRLGISPQTAATWRSKGIGPKFIVLNGAIRYRPEQIEAYLTAQTVDPSAAPRPDIKRRKGGTGRAPWKHQRKRNRSQRRAQEQ